MLETLSVENYNQLKELVDEPSSLSILHAAAYGNSF